MDSPNQSVPARPPAAAAHLDYAPAPRRRQKWIRRLLVGLMAFAAAGVLWWWGPAAWRQAWVLRWQRQSMRWAEPPERVVYEEDPTSAAALLASGAPYGPYSLKQSTLEDGAVVGSPPVTGAAYLPDSWNNLSAAMSSKPGRALGAGRAVIFLHERISPSGKRRLVCVQYFAQTDTFTPQLINGFNVAPYVIEPATWNSPPRALNTGWTINVLSGIPRKPPLVRVFAGQPDPNDASHFTVRYQMWGTEDVIDGWLGDDDRITLKQRRMPTPP